MRYKIGSGPGPGGDRTRTEGLPQCCKLGYGYGVWCGVVWRGVVWCGVVWCAVWRGALLVGSFDWLQFRSKDHGRSHYKLVQSVSNLLQTDRPFKLPRVLGLLVVGKPLANWDRTA